VQPGLVVGLDDLAEAKLQRMLALIHRENGHSNGNHDGDEDNE
jgi:hypothetical protein